MQMGTITVLREKTQLGSEKMNLLTAALPLALCLSEGKDSQDTDPIQQLWTACKAGDQALTERLIAAGVDVNVRTEFQATALYFAAGNGHAELCGALVDAGAELGVADSFYGNTPITLAGWLGHAEVVEMLISKGSGQWTETLFGAAVGGRPQVIDALLRLRAAPQQTLDAAWQTAAGAGQLAAAARLAEAGAATGPSPAAGESTSSLAGLESPTETRVPCVDPAPWPGFRGPSGSGIADGQHPPITWNLDTGHNVRWKVKVPGLGHSSPVIWGNRVFLTTAIGTKPHLGTTQRDSGLISPVKEEFPHRFEVHCYELSSGRLLWQRLCHEGVPRNQRHWKASHASATCAVDGEFVVAFFGSEGLFGLNWEGEILWSKDLGDLKTGWFVDDSFEWGFASSPTLWEGQVFVQCDVAGDDFVTCLEVDSGEELWRTPREELPAWGTPLLCEGPEGPELILNATRAICSYDPESGEELWRLAGNSKITVASPVAAGEVVYVTGGYQTPSPIYAVRLGSRGDLTLQRGQTSSEAVLWSYQRDGSYHPTPLIYDDRLYLLRDNGVLAAYDLDSGKRRLRKRVLDGQGTAHTSSPVAADGHLYLTGEDGEVFVLEATEQARLVALNDLQERCLTTPAISNGTLVFRTVSHLLGIAYPPLPGPGSQ
jgi:outer membrane protein assembly factor BamB